MNKWYTWYAWLTRSIQESCCTCCTLGGHSHPIPMADIADIPKTNSTFLFTSRASLILQSHNSASCLCLRHAIITPIIKFIIFFFHTPKVSAFSLVTRKSQKSQLTSPRFLCPAPSGPTRFGHHVLYNLVVGPRLQAVTPTLVISLTARVEPSDQVEMKSARNLHCGAWWNARLSAALHELLA